MGTVGFLHTSRVHVARFDELMLQWPAHRGVHVVDEDLLADSITHGVDSVRQGVRAALGELVRIGADLVVCTCSTLGALAEEVAGDTAVMRVDRPMAAAAVDQSRRIGVVVAVESTVEPTESLLREEAARAGREVSVEMVLAEGAWARFVAGDGAGYLRLVVAAARDLDRRSDVIVLAQVSMADAAEELKDLQVAVLSSPEQAVRRAVASL